MSWRRESWRQAHGRRDHGRGRSGSGRGGPRGYFDPAERDSLSRRLEGAQEALGGVLGSGACDEAAGGVKTAPAGAWAGAAGVCWRVDAEAERFGDAREVRPEWCARPAEGWPRGVWRLEDARGSVIERAATRGAIEHLAAREGAAVVWEDLGAVGAVAEMPAGPVEAAEGQRSPEAAEA